MNFPDYIAAHLSTSFAWGVHDCIIFSIGGLEVASGKKFMPKVTWTDEKSARLAVKKLGGLEKEFERNLTRIDKNFAQDGDLALCDGGAYLFSGAHIVSVGEEGLIFKSRMDAQCAFTWRDHA